MWFWGGNYIVVLKFRGISIIWEVVDWKVNIRSLFYVFGGRYIVGRKKNNIYGVGWLGVGLGWGVEG